MVFPVETVNPIDPVRRPRLAPLLGGLVAVACGVAAPAQDADADDPARAFFASQPVVTVQIVLDDAAREALTKAPREYVAAGLRLDGATFAKVGLKLKGAAGSFQTLGERPGFTVNLGKFGDASRFHGLARFHLNNGVQDASRLCEWLGWEVFTAARLPAPRVAHAIVRLDDRLLGLYVFRESFDRQFLRRTFGEPAHGNLYDGGFCQDVDRDLEKDHGDGPDDRSDLRALCELCRGIDRNRAPKLQAAIDVPTFLDFAALEAMLGHWDGYTQNANNFRLWLPTGGRATFLPHGMDQLFGEADASILDHPPAIVASAVMQQPALRKRYRERLRTLLPLFAPDRLRPRVLAVAEKVQRTVRPVDPGIADAQAEAVRDLLARIEARYASLVDQVKAPEPKPVQVTKGRPWMPKTWLPVAETDGLIVDKKTTQDTPSLRIAVVQRGDEPRRGLWRTHVLLGPGRYELRATVRCAGVEPPPKGGDGSEQGGVLVRADGNPSKSLQGDASWQALVSSFQITEFQCNVELACELHALAGQAWFRSDSLQLVRVGD